MVRVRKSWMWVGVVMLDIAGWTYYYSHSHVIAVETVAMKQGDLTVSVTPTETGTDDNDAKQKYDKKRKLFDARLVPQGERESAAADLATAEAVLETARANREQVTLQQRQIELAAADVKQQQAALRVAEVTFDHSVIRSPLAGTVVELPVKLGELLQPGSVAARVTCLDALYVKEQIDEVDLSQLRVGQRADVQFDTEPNTKYSAELFEISPAVSVEML